MTVEILMQKGDFALVYNEADDLPYALFYRGDIIIEFRHYKEAVASFKLHSKNEK